MSKILCNKIIFKERERDIKAKNFLKATITGNISNITLHDITDHHITEFPTYIKKC